MNRPDPGRLAIRTPEGAIFTLATAGPTSRMLAWLIDLGVISVTLSLVAMLARMIAAVQADIGLGIYFLLNFLITTGYAILLEWFWRGQTLGKRLLRLRVMDQSGLKLQFSQILLRNLLRVIDALPLCYLVGGSAALLSRINQRLGDLAAGTVVVHAERPALPDLEKILPDKFNSLREHPLLASRLRQRVTPAEAALALRALLRREGMTPAGRASLFAELARHFRRLVPFPEEASEGLTDERYVYNVVDILFRAR